MIRCKRCGHEMSKHQAEKGGELVVRCRERLSDVNAALAGTSLCPCTLLGRPGGSGGG